MDRTDWNSVLAHLLGAALFVGGLLAAAIYRLDH